MRPLFSRYSSVPTAKSILQRLIAASTALLTSSKSPPSSMTRIASSRMRPDPISALFVSTTSTGLSTIPAAVTAES
jgi:hypothetical protein